MSSERGSALLDIRSLDVRFHVTDGSVHAVRGLNLVVHRGEVAAIVGESGSGKSAAMLAALGLLDPNATVTGDTTKGRKALARNHTECLAARA